jgi:hypothetical protein
MFAALALAAALSGQAGGGAAEASPAPVYGPAAPAPPKAAAPVKRAECPPTPAEPNAQEIVVCAQRPQGYRIDPDVLAAKKAKRQALAGRAKPPENLKDHSCRVVGSAPCMDAPMINVLAAAATLGKMADRISKGQEIGSLFVTDPQLSEYQYYQLAKKEREAKEAAAAAKAKAAAAKADAGADAGAAPASPQAKP